MSASFDSKRFFEDAEKFFTELQTSIDTQHSEQKKSQAKELDTLQRLLEERIASAQDVIQEQRTTIEKLSTTQTQQTQFIQELTRQIRELNERIEVLSTAAATIVPAPVVQPIQPNAPVQAPPADAEQENAAPAGASSKKAAKPKAPKSPDKEVPVAAIPESEPTAPPIVTAATPEVAVVQAPDITVEQAPAFKPTIEAMPVAEQQIPAAEDMNALVLERFLKQPAIKEIIEKLNGMPTKNDLTLTKHRNVLNCLITFMNPGTHQDDVYEFSLNLWLLTLLLKDKNSYEGEMNKIFGKPNETKDLARKYDGNPDLTVKIKLATMMSKNLSDAYKKDPKKYISEHSDAIRSITKSLEAHCEGITGADSQVWIKFLNKWLTKPNG